MVDQPRVLMFGPVPVPLAGWLAAASVERVADWTEAANRIDGIAVDALVTDSDTAREFLAGYRRDQLVLESIQNGIALLDPRGIVTWAHPVFAAWCSANPVGRPFFEALDAQTIAADTPNPLEHVLHGKCVQFRLHRPIDRERPYLDVTVRPVLGPNDEVRQMVAMTRNVTAEVEQQRKLDALHQAGRDLAGLDPEQLAEMNVPTRVELLKQNLRRYIRDLLRYDIIEVRVLDRRSGELKPLLEDGMTTEAARRKLYARLTENGVTGYVAATGESYLCDDTADDPHYIRGAEGARSSMTVPLKHQDEVIGTLNVESPRPNAFGPDDFQFTELFSKEIAAALHTLDLLTAQQTCTAAQSLDAVSREIALPVDEVIGAAAVLLTKLADDPESAAQLRKILGAARGVKESVKKVGRDLTGEPEAVTLGPGTLPLSGKRVLVIDPDERMRKSAHLLLTRLGAGVESAGTATSGVALLADTPYDAVFLDIKPGDMGGYEAYKRLRAARTNVPIAMTMQFGYDSTHAIVKARADGMKHVLFKPYRADQVVPALLDGSAMPPAVVGKPA